MLLCVMYSHGCIPLYEGGLACDATSTLLHSVKHMKEMKEFSFFFSGLRLRHVEVPRPGVKLKLQLPAYTKATATRDPSCVFNPHHSSRQRQILNSLSEARD